MLLFYILIFSLTLWGIHYQPKGFHDGYIDIKQCNAIKGVFILLVFLRHIYPYLQTADYSFDSFLDCTFLSIDHHIGQLLVVMFLFYSGYGIMESIQKKGKHYIDSIPRRRILSTLFNFDIAVCFFILLDLFLGIPLKKEQVILSFIGWRSVGNSNWYIFIILLCYLLTFICFKFTTNWPKVGQASLLTFLCLLCICGLSLVKEGWWYDTMLCFPAGVLFSLSKEKIEPYLKKHYVGALLASILLFAALHFAHSPRMQILRGLTYNMQSITFACFIVLMTMKIKVNNPILQWLGVQLFPLYIYQRIPMLAFSKALPSPVIVHHPYLFVIVCLAISVVIASCYKHWQISLR